MSTALVSAFYDINDVIQQSKQRPSSLDLRLRFERRQPCSPSSLASRRHSASAINTLHTKPITTPTVFNATPGSPKEKIFNFPVPRDRSFSTPQITEENEQQQRKRTSTNSSRYKTELCRPFEENGTCKYGDKCQFAHGLNELRSLSRHPKYKTEFCRTYHTIGFCPYGPRCHFIHNDEEKRSSPPTQSHLRSLSMSSMNSGPPSPILDAISSPFPGSMTPPMSPSSYVEVFAFSEELASPAVTTLASTNSPRTSSAAVSFPDQNPYPSPSNSEFSPRSPMLIAPSSPTLGPIASPIQSSIQSSGSSYDAADTRVIDLDSNTSESPPSSPGERLRRLPVFNNIA